MCGALVVPPSPVMSTNSKGTVQSAEMDEPGKLAMGREGAAWGKIKIKTLFLFATATQLRQIFPVCYVSLFVALFSETNSRLSGAAE